MLIGGRELERLDDVNSRVEACSYEIDSDVTIDVMASTTF